MRNKTNKIVVFLLSVLLAGMVLEGCSSSKNCGCGADLNKAYKPSRHYR